LDDFQAALNHGGIGQLSLLRPFGKMTKRQVMELGRKVPLELTFSCISPVDNLHCGRCNKCAERQSAFREAGMKDGTRYAG
jgi:7-cyano-7-deazaguanine synthase